MYTTKGSNGIKVRSQIFRAYWSRQALYLQKAEYSFDRLEL